ncbi:MAG: hypothetical protein E6Q76_04840 [Rhizobium sp.]|nr:MAG: hypothetical protein E6Q76_04840 [Rhizobium sp.]
MQTRNIFLIGAGLIAAAACAGQAFAQPTSGQTSDMHQMRVRLPDGTLELIRYSGNRPPAVLFPNAPNAVPASDALDDASPFADLERISAAMDRESAALLNDAPFLTRWPDGDDLMHVDLSELPKGTQGYRMISTTSGKGTCTQTTEYFDRGGGKPEVKTSSSGNCGTLQGSPVKVVRSIAPHPAPKHQPPGVIEASYQPKSKSIRTAGLF